MHALEIADRLFGAIARGDIDAVRALYADDVQVWHNTDGVAQSADENLVTLRWVVGHMRNLRYEDVRRQATDSGFVQQHVLRGVVGETPIEIPACLVVAVRDGRITRIDEYIDSAHVRPLLAAAARRG